MKRTLLLSIPRLAAVIFAGTCLILISPARAQMEDEHPTGDNPHLRSTPTPAATAQPTKLSQKDQKFIQLAAAAGAQEIADGRVAEKQGGEGVKKIAGRIVADRMSSNKELATLAKKKGLGFNTDSIKARNIGKTNFDKQYIYSVTHDYQEDIKTFQRQAQSGDDKDIKAWAARTVPMLKSHLGMLQGAEH